MRDNISVKGAREHNLKNIDLELPRNKLIVITGLSGSGKSTLAFDTIYAEGQRRYVESLSAYARQFLGLMDKPDVDSIEGLSPAISIEQKSTSKNPRSTVGTVTEIYDYLRLLFARIGTHHCPKCGSSIHPQSPENITSLIMAEKGKPLTFLAPIIRGMKGTHESIFDDLKKEGYTKIRVDQKIYEVDHIKEELKLVRYEKHWIEAVIDTVTIEDEERSRLAEAVEGALKTGKGTMIIIDAANTDAGKKKELERFEGETMYSTFGACPNHPEIVFESLEPRMFSFNSPFGACSICHGLGEITEVTEDKVIPDKNLSIMDGALAIYKSTMDLSWRAQQLAAVGRKHGFDVFTPIKNFTEQQLKVLLYGDREPINANWSNGANMSMKDGWEGVIPQTMRLYRQTESEWRKVDIEKFMTSRPCNACHGKKLQPVVLAVQILEKSIIDITDLSIEESVDFFHDLPPKLNEKDLSIAKQVLKEINERLGFLKNVGLGYLSLSRAAKTLSGGEAQRIRLATQIGSNLVGVLYILDEPSIGLHQRDNAKLINTLARLRDLGNTLIVVEHDEDTMRHADYIVDMGPGAGVHGGHIVAEGPPELVMQNPRSLTGQYLSGKLKIAVPQERRKPTGSITVKGASENNLKHLSVNLPLGVLCGITGVSGSGKSTLMNLTIIPALKQLFGEQVDKVGKHVRLQVPETIRNVIVIDQDPIGRTPRSNPATYTKLFDEIRRIFAATKEAKARGYKEGRFSFNVKGGRCETCQGDGVLRIEMNFLPDVYVQCSECKGKRYNKETLAVQYKGKNIAEVLDMTVEEAAKFFENTPQVHRKLQTLLDVGLGYIKLGQSSTQLSGGESQRIKITRELSKHKSGHVIYMLDEPTTGLHFDDTKRLISVLNRLVDNGNTVYIIEHNLDVIKSCDQLIDLGPEGGAAGGQLLAQGTPEEVALNETSYTGLFLKKILHTP
ncbi:excinuclease ABC subunit UvrA [Candidatus Bathycorpusculum sp.]|uniref:excinuclease ABC subunit UvrA n=1 Tax=Candidatus Bathycorpusculum sp. TaxID=2994959 RepID=UPI00282F59EB|nr:excinuclease ABC subunit UvrA [Candidatus Termitimicrobium sp.]MCL2431058.1 excinuclease ABC subunit UvrA [Candidatus Termitimicrobium sp.]